MLRETDARGHWPLFATRDVRAILSPARAFPITTGPDEAQCPPADTSNIVAPTFSLGAEYFIKYLPLFALHFAPGWMVTESFCLRGRPPADRWYSPLLLPTVSINSILNQILRFRVSIRLFILTHTHSAPWSGSVH